MNRLYATVICLLCCDLFSCKLVSSKNDLSLVNGKLDTSNRFSAVIQTSIQDAFYETNEKGERVKVVSDAMCTASVISERVVLTAAHCLTKKQKALPNSIDQNGDLLANNNPGWPGGAFGLRDYRSRNFTAYTGRDFTGSGGGVELSKKAGVYLKGNKGDRVDGGKPIIHPEYTGNSGPDVAVVVFPEGTFKGYKFMKVATPLKEKVDIDTKVVIVGFGKTDQFDANSGGEKRYGTNILTGVNYKYGMLNFEGQTQSTGQKRKDGSTVQGEAVGTNVFNSQGDSGGPMIAASGPYKGMIIGVSSTQNTVKKGDTRGQGNYASLVHPSTAQFLQKYLGDGSALDLESGFEDTVPGSGFDRDSRRSDSEGSLADDDWFVDDFGERHSADEFGIEDEESLADVRPDRPDPVRPQLENDELRIPENSRPQDRNQLNPNPNRMADNGRFSKRPRRFRLGNLFKRNKCVCRHRPYFKNWH